MDIHNFEKELLSKLQFKASSRLGVDTVLLKIFKFFDLTNEGSLRKQDFLRAIAKAGVTLADQEVPLTSPCLVRRPPVGPLLLQRNHQLQRLYPKSRRRPWRSRRRQSRRQSHPKCPSNSRHSARKDPAQRRPRFARPSQRLTAAIHLPAPPRPTPPPRDRRRKPLPTLLRGVHEPPEPPLSPEGIISESISTGSPLQRFLLIWAACFPPLLDREIQSRKAPGNKDPPKNPTGNQRRIRPGFGNVHPVKGNKIINSRRLLRLLFVCRILHPKRWNLQVAHKRSVGRRATGPAGISAEREAEAEFLAGSAIAAESLPKQLPTSDFFPRVCQAGPALSSLSSVCSEVS